ncbi:hypothetical protein NMQ14_18820 [Methyloversatilis sp. XJ19-13]|uniref:hypothetical protein n=1 Tax=Methyloversatilis sp. XJ19-13 TaxID=2963430 RepID=UPI00211C9D0F|nr:hypothetical protein [Methyloversatilis sp. XJ19-13]MCQ9376301.1 hypothetical protein [Methyloversatilis sp. XJ19-13]
MSTNQASVDAINNKKALIEAQDALMKAQVALLKNRFPAFSEDFGNAGALTIESAERDKFHVTARSAEAFRSAARQIANAIKNDGNPVVLMTDADRASVPTFWSERAALQRVDSEIIKLLGDIPKDPDKESSLALFGIGTIMSQVAQFTQLARTDRSLAFTDSLLPDELLYDLVAIELSQTALYPGAAVDAILATGAASTFAKQFDAIAKRRATLTKVDGKDKEKAAAVLAEFDELSARLVAVDASTEMPLLLTVLRGELVDQFLIASKGRTLSIKVASKGGTSLKVTSVWRSDRLYAAGGVVASYRLTAPGPNGGIAKAGVVISETPFKYIPLE